MHNYGQGYLVPLCKFTTRVTANTSFKAFFFCFGGGGEFGSRQQCNMATRVPLEYFRPCSKVG